MRAVRVRAPATSANLGPGFDCAGLCLSLYDEVTVRQTSGGLVVDVHGHGAADLPRDEAHLVVAAMRTAFDRLGGQPAGLHVSCRNQIPQSRGLGSSSAAIVAGVLAARALVDDGARLLDDDAVLGLADELEGHPDNVAACLRGGVTLALRGPAGLVAVRRDAHPDLLPVAFVPPTRGSTQQARALLPAVVPHADAAANAAAAALLPLALTQDLGLLMAATRDRLHQHHRAPAMPGSAALVEQLRGNGVAAVVSGAGPTVLALGHRDEAPGLLARAPSGWGAGLLPVDAAGAALAPLVEGAAASGS